MFYNSLIPAEQQFLVNAMRFESSQLKSEIVKSNVLIQLNRVSHDVAVRVAQVLGMDAPAADPTFYNDNSTAFVSIFNNTLPTIAGFKVAVLASVASPASIAQASSIVKAFEPLQVKVAVIAERLVEGVNATYSASDASTFDGIIVAEGAEGLFGQNATASTFFPKGRPGQILGDGWRWGKPVGAIGSASSVMGAVGVVRDEGVFEAGDVGSVVTGFEGGLKTFKFVGRFALDTPVGGER
jgi:catalase